MARIRILMVLVLALTAGGVLALGTYNYVQRSPVQGQGRAILDCPTEPRSR